MTNPTNERDQRQFSLMLRQIVDYEAGYLSLGSLIGDLEFLHAALDEKDRVWSHKFDRAVMTLETCCAVMLDEQRKAPSDAETKPIAGRSRILRIWSRARSEYE